MTDGLAGDLGVDDPRFTAGLDMLGRTGVLEVDIRFQDDHLPVVWMVGGRWKFLGERVVPGSSPGTSRWEFAGGLSPLVALLRLLEVAVDGGRCTHCSRPTMFFADLSEGSTPMDPLFCMYEWDPELGTYRRGCE